MIMLSQGVPVKDLEKQFYKQKGTARRLFAFPSEDRVALPDNAPATIAKVRRIFCASTAGAIRRLDHRRQECDACAHSNRQM